MTDLKSPGLMYLKAFCFLLILGSAATLLMLAHPTWQTAGLVILVAWASARLYYFMFYVIEKYVDGAYKFSGVMSFLAHLLGRKRSRDDTRE